MSILTKFHPVVADWFTAQFAAPTPPQSRGWPAIAGGNHTLILAPTGSGKTLAAFLWSIDELYRRAAKIDARDFAENAEGVHTLYISPLKALNNDIEKNLQAPLAGIARLAARQGRLQPEIRVGVRTGDTPPHIRQAMLRRPPHILITTPESLFLLLTSERGRELFRTVRYLIIDEIHALCNSKRGVHLSLSVERLLALCAAPPTRIGLSATQRPLERIAAYLGGQEYDGRSNRFLPRPVIIVDCGLHKKMQLRVVSPVEDFSDLPDATVWPAVVEKLYAEILAHRSTLVFVNMRGQAERLARQLNARHRESAGEEAPELALAHHGSISREARYEVETRLKKGTIPAVIATGSLELGIDIGDIELVVQLESPRQVSAMLQRAGRSGHSYLAESRGKVIPLYPADLDDAVALAACALQNDIEETRIPENCLDVLAQQIVAETANRMWSRPALFTLVRQSYCYRHLTLQAFDNVLEMLAGRYAEAPLRALSPRISWDKINDRLIGRRGSRLLAIMNAGTIPDRGYYGVFLADSAVRLGEMEEEFVFESRVGDVFFLGSNEWRIQEITPDRIIVTPVRAIQPRAPFWKGDLLMRDFSTSLKIGAFRRRVAAEMEAAGAGEVVRLEQVADAATARNLRAYFQRQIAHTGRLPTDRTFVAESCRDHAGEPVLLLHAPVGARVTGAWAVVLAGLLEKKYGLQMQYDFDDDGFIFRLIDAGEDLPLRRLLVPDPAEAEKVLVQAMANTPTFAIHFRYNVARALLLPRSTARKRIPLWLQRLRAADLLQAVRAHPDFPIVLETLRDCLHDVFDLDGLKTVLTKLSAGEIELHSVNTPSPSPMASGMMYRFLAAHLYETDRARPPGEPTIASGELLATLLDSRPLPAVLMPEHIAAAEARWQHRTHETMARSAEELLTVIEKLGPIGETALAACAAGPVMAWLQSLQAASRLVLLTGDPRLWESSEIAAQLAGLAAGEKARQQVLRFLRTRGPRTLDQMASATGVQKDRLRPILEALDAEKLVVRGALLQSDGTEYWCERQNFAELYRAAIALRRRGVSPAPYELFYPFTLHWHGVGKAGGTIEELLGRYAGLQMPLHFLEREILPTRTQNTSMTGIDELLAGVRRCIARGDFIARGSPVATLRSLYFTARAAGALFHARENLQPDTAALADAAAEVARFLKENGASPFRDILAGTGLSRQRTMRALQLLAAKGLAASDDYAGFLQTLGRNNQPAAGDTPRAAWPALPPGRTSSQRRLQEEIRSRLRGELREGRWFLTSSFAAHGKPLSANEQAEQQARLLLARYGILIKAWYRREAGFLPWHKLFQTLKRLEWQGEIRRGYFIDGLSGVQFALPRAVEDLQALRDGRVPAPAPVLLSTADPALPLGGHIDWRLQDIAGERPGITRGAQNHLLFFEGKPALYSENYGQRLLHLGAATPPGAAAICQAMRRWLLLPAALRPRKRIEIHQIDEKPAAQHRLAAGLCKEGFEIEANKLVLWPSQVR